VNHGACLDGIQGSQVGFKRDIHPIAGTNFVPRMSMGGEIAVIMPVINAPFRLYYAYNPLRLDERPYCNLGAGKNQSCNTLITPAMFPNATADCSNPQNGGPGVRSAKPLPGAAQDLPADGIDDLLRAVFNRQTIGAAHGSGPDGFCSAQRVLSTENKMCRA
jgi:hypothetical protein